MDLDDFLIEDDTLAPTSNAEPPPWLVLVVDDCFDIIAVTNAVLNGTRFEGREIKLLNAESASEALHILRSHPDIAVALVDVVMETDDAGLRLVTAIRENLSMHAIRIILRTGQPGHAPDRDVILKFDINDYRLKSELTYHSLFTSVVAAIRAFSEISARIRAEEEALIAARSKSQFLASISHELRTPLNAIIGFSDIIVHQFSSDDVMTNSLEYVKEIYDNGIQLLSVVNELIDMASIDAGRYQLREQVMVVSDLFTACTSALSTRAAANGVTFVTRSSDQVPMILLDHTAFSQVISNLLSNAIKFSPHGGNVELVASIAPDGRPAISVTDHGIGIPAHRLHNLFTPFTQVDAGHNRTYEGVGLGLAIVKGLVNLHGGTIDVQSIEGQGTTITAYLPTSRLITC